MTHNPNIIFSDSHLGGMLHGLAGTYGETIPRIIAYAGASRNAGGGSGGAIGSRVVIQKTGTIQFAMMAHRGNGTNGTDGNADYRYCLWNSSGTLIATSANLKDAITSSAAISGTGWVTDGAGGANNVVFAKLNAVSGQSLARTAGETMYAGIAAYIGTGGTPAVANFQGLDVTGSWTRYEPALSFRITGYTGGDPGNLTTTLAAYDIDDTASTFNVNRATTGPNSLIFYVALY